MGLLITFMQNSGILMLIVQHKEYVWLLIHVLILVNHNTVYPKKYAHGFVVLCFVVVM